MDRKINIEKAPQKKSKFATAFYFLFALIVIACFYPYEFQSVYPMVFPQEGPVLQIVLTLAVAIVYLTCRNKVRLPNSIWSLLFVQFLGFSLCYIAQGQPQVIIIYLMLVALFLSLLALIHSSIGLVSFFKLYNRWILLMALLGTVAWFLTNYMGFQPLYVVLDKVDTNRELYNYILTFSVHDSYETAMRYSGFFDEPGAIANWGMFALLINKLFVDDKRIELPLIVCLLFTFSMGFYVQLILYYLFFYVKKNSSKKRGVIVIAVVALVFFFLSTLKEEQGSNRTQSVYEMTIGRFTNMFQESRNKNTIIAVDDRSELAEIARNEFLENPLFGTSKQIYLGDNLYEPLAMYGLIGALLIYSPIIWLLFSALRRGDKSMVNAVIIIIIGFLHRPYHRNLLWNIIIYGIIAMYLLYRYNNPNKTQIQSIR